MKFSKCDDGRHCCVNIRPGHKSIFIGYRTVVVLLLRLMQKLTLLYWPVLFVLVDQHCGIAVFGYM